ncbi:MAG: hypothetical protein SGJ02_13115, partial [bacterium]|nr:hypothetical protein [bacterium]
YVLRFIPLHAVPQAEFITFVILINPIMPLLVLPLIFNNFLNIDSPLPAIVDILILQSCAETKIEILENIFSITIKFPLRNS